MEKNKVLVTGSQSGLGKFIYEKTNNAIEFNRDNTIDDVKDLDLDIIIHCANNKAIQIDSTQLLEYMKDNLLLTYELSKIPCNKFIYISTVDVYPKNGMLHREDEIIDIKKVSNVYGLTKLMSEQLVKENRDNYLILRPTALLGPYMKPNSLTKILTGNYVNFTLAKQSSFNYVLYDDIYNFISFACKENLGGIFNLASKSNVSLLQVAQVLGKEDVPFGDYEYHIGHIDNSLVNEFYPSFNKETLDIIKLFKESYK